MRRVLVVVASSVALLLAAVVVSAAGRSDVSLTLLHQGQPPQLVAPGDQTEFEYELDLPGGAKPTGTLYVRSDRQSGFTVLPLQLGFASGRHPRLHVTLPARFLSGKRLFYYAQLRDPASGASLTIPAKGARAPQTSWILHAPVVVHLGAYRFGHTEAAEAIVAHAAAKSIGWNLPAQSGPYTFLVGRDRSIWLEDSWKHRMLVWRAGKPNEPVRSVPLPAEGRRDVHFQDVTFGPKGTLYVSRIQRAVPGFQVFRIDATTGKVLWKSSSPNLWQGLPSSVPLRICNGTLYGLVDAAGLEVTGTPEYGWLPLATPAGKPIPPAQQFGRIVWGHEPVSAGRRFVAEAYAPPHWRYLPREVRFATINRNGRLLRAWRVVSKTSIDEDGFLAPELFDGRIVADLLNVAGPGSLEHLFIRLDSRGLDANASIPFRMWGAEESTDVRVGPEGKIYALETSPKTGIVIRRYSLGRG